MAKYKELKKKVINYPKKKKTRANKARAESKPKTDPKSKLLRFGQFFVRQKFRATFSFWLYNVQYRVYFISFVIYLVMLHNNRFVDCTKNHAVLNTIL